jgi:hypothetical protein
MRRRKTRGKGAYGLVKARYIHNRSSKTGRHVTADLQRLIYYNVYGNEQNNPDKIERGFIYDEKGNMVRYGDYKAWGIGKSVESRYSYRVIISPKGHLLHDQDFVTAVATASEKHGLADEFRIVIHRDSEHAHGHLLFQADSTLRRNVLEAWKVDLRKKMMELETVRAKENGVSVPTVESDEGTRQQSRDRDYSY